MRLTIVRHGETVENKTGILQGQRHGRLSLLGKEQARLLAKRLSREHFDIIYASDLRRVKQTLQPLLTHKPRTKVVFTKELRERSFGPLEGKDNKSIDFINEERHGKLSGKTRAETIEQFYLRILKFLKHIKKRHNGKRVLVITHGGTKLALIASIKKIPFHTLYVTKTRIGNTSVTIVSFKGKKHRFHRIGCTRHLRNI
ncbi:MAG: histidine phosphatase family protein [Nanoarchaeota archaeon]